MMLSELDSCFLPNHGRMLNPSPCLKTLGLHPASEEGVDVKGQKGHESVSFQNLPRGPYWPTLYSHDTCWLQRILRWREYTVDTRLRQTNGEGARSSMTGAGLLTINAATLASSEGLTLPPCSFL